MAIFPAHWRDPPWCSGREYNNAPGEFKVRCEQRGPPWWWLVTGHDFDPDPLGFNGTHLLSPYSAQTGWDSDSTWAWFLTSPSGAYKQVGWFKSVVTPGKFVLALSCRYGSSSAEIKIFHSQEYDFAINWWSFDGLTPNNVYTSPGWSHGANATLQVQVGDYSRIPAKSCRGDYNGPWPP